MAGTSRRVLQVMDQGDLTVVRFVDPQIVDEVIIKAIGDQLFGLVEDLGRLKLRLDFTGVELMASAMLGKLVATQRKLEAHGGRIAFCKVDAFLLQIFNLVRLPDLIPICADEQEAIESL